MNEKEIIKVRNLHLDFDTREGKARVLNGIDFDLLENETLAIVGESGSGKSVFTRTIMGLLPNTANITSGEILYKKRNSEIINLRLLSDKDYVNVRGNEISMIFQDPMSSLNPVLPIGKQIQEAILVNSKENISKKEAKKRSIELLDKVGISSPKQRYKQYPHQFSGGMRQRVVIAIALACDPKVLIADEPTTALDVTIQAQILELIKKLQKEKKFSIIFITHDLGVVANVADRVNVMYSGEIIEKGLLDEIFYDPRHPYTWGLLESIPDLDEKKDKLFSIPGFPPNIIKDEIKGDPFAPRNKWALNIDWIKRPPMFKITDTHYAATWLLDERAPKVELPTDDN